MCRWRQLSPNGANAQRPAAHAGAGLVGLCGGLWLWGGRVVVATIARCGGFPGAPGVGFARRRGKAQGARLKVRERYHL